MSKAGGSPITMPIWSLLGSARTSRSWATTLVDRLIFDGRRCTGVVAILPTGPREFRAREVIVAAGAIHSPAILQRSGIGPRGLARRSRHRGSRRPAGGRRLLRPSLLPPRAQAETGAAGEGSAHPPHQLPRQIQFGLSGRGLQRHDVRGGQPRRHRPCAGHGAVRRGRPARDALRVPQPRHGAHHVGRTVASSPISTSAC